MTEVRFTLHSMGEAAASVRDPIPQSGLCECVAGPTDLEIGLTGKVVVSEGTNIQAALAIPLRDAKVSVWHQLPGLVAGGITANGRRRPAIWRCSPTLVALRVGPERIELPLYKPVCLLNLSNGPTCEGAAAAVLPERGLSFTAVGFRIEKPPKLWGISARTDKARESAMLWRYAVNPKNPGETFTTGLDLTSLVAESRWQLHRATNCMSDGNSLVVEGVGTYRAQTRKFRLTLTEA